MCMCLQAFRAHKDGNLNKVSHGDVVSSVFKGAGGRVFGWVMWQVIGLKAK